MKFYIIVLIAAYVAVASAAVHYKPPEGDIPIISKSFELNALDGSYGYEWETGNGISVSENGVGGQYARGSAEWTAPDGTPVFFQYTADENGFQPTGSHVPQIPPQIARALEWIKAHPQPEESYKK